MSTGGAIFKRRAVINVAVRTQDLVVEAVPLWLRRRLLCEKAERVEIAEKPSLLGQ